MSKITDKERDVGMIYMRRGLRRPERWVLAHNNIRHGKNTVNGFNGFRCFWLKSRKGWSVCPCGWRPDRGVHYCKHAS